MTLPEAENRVISAIVMILILIMANQTPDKSVKAGCFRRGWWFFTRPPSHNQRKLA
ncbi:putative membrane protein [Duffyella gerundensis]|uniref:Putative membrane protein n=1 Tax=Duffyella gerundensis TaxID=1619313 RepID=A0A0U5L4T9_9GAMM|nr:putative membrane protein [Duffyella gerundensis]